MPKSKKRKTNHFSSSNSQGNGGLSHAEIWDDSALIRSWNDALAEYEFYHSIHAKGEDVEKVLREAEEAEEAERLEWQLAQTQNQPNRQSLRTLDDHVSDTAAVEDDTQLLSKKVEGQGGGGGEVDVEDGEIDECNDKVDRPESTTHYSHSVHRASHTDESQSHPADNATDTSTIHELGGQKVTRSPSSSQEKSDPPIDPTRTSTVTVPSATDSNTLNPSLPASSAIVPDQTLENLKMAYYWAGYYSGLHDGQRQNQAPCSSTK